MEVDVIMGTNFYLVSKDTEQAKAEYIKAVTNHLMNGSFWEAHVVINEMENAIRGYHIAKTSAGWLPLFDGSHGKFKSVRELKDLYDTGDYFIEDEYGHTWDWDAFDVRVLQFNGGVRGAREQTIVQYPAYNIGYPPVERVPISHFEYDGGRYADEYHTDPDGYEFTSREFS